LPEGEVTDASVGYASGPAHAAWLGCDWQSDAQQCHSILSGSTDWLIVDHYALDNRWESAMREKCHHIMCVDDLADRTHDCDILLDQSLGRTADDYSHFVSSDTRLLLGPQYALLRCEFAQWRDISLARRQSPKMHHILVTMGGVDYENVTGRVLAVLAQIRFETLRQITVVLGPHAPWHDTVSAFAAGMKVRTTVLSNVENMAELMTSCDLAIGAGGSTTWERCSLGLPTIMVSLAENQKFISQEVSRSGGAILCDLANLECELENILYLVLQLDFLKELSIKASNITDGLGMQMTRQIIKEF
jgi:UDP-2,4-diacetamido-2,4,6-trideoxy-beta-L-altropyranose hydrolase